jgi:hypothetical protein
MRKCNALISVFLAAMLSAFCANEASSHPINSQHNFGINKDYVYVLPHSGLIKKIHKNTGDVVWKTQIMMSGSDTELLTWGSYSSPLFVDNRMFAVELFEKRLLGFDLESGQVIAETHTVPFFCGWLGEGFPAGRIVICDEDLMVFDSLGMRVWDLPDLNRKWTFSCSEHDLYWLNDFFKSGDYLYLFITRQTGGSSREEAYKNPQFLEDELVELNCATGEVVKRYDGDVFFEDKYVKRWSLVELGEWHGKTLLLVKSELANYALYTLDPISKSITLLASRHDYRPADEAWWDPGLKPVLLGDSIF